MAMTAEVLVPQNLDYEEIKMNYATRNLTSEANKISEDSIGLLFKEMARYPLLKPGEEIELARSVQELLTLEKLEQNLQQELGIIPSKAEVAAAAEITETQLQQRLNLGRIAKRKMISSNLRLVVSIAKHYLNCGVPFLDLIQEGTLGLNRATEKFDPAKGYRFSTYAYWWIRQGITRTLATQGRTIRLPVHIIEQISRLKRGYQELKRSLQRPPTEKELAEALLMTPEHLRELQQMRRKLLSLNRRIGTEESSELMDILEDSETPSPENQMNEIMMRQDILEVLGSILTDREKDILTLRYGLLTGEPHTLDEVSGMFNLSRERVRQIQNKAMRKLRRPQVTERLKGWLR
jgi:RNA polymerase sigma factor (RpoD-like family)